MQGTEWIASYGYIAVFLGTFLEGEGTLIMAGIAVHLGLLDLPGIIASGGLGAFVGDQIFFQVGRHGGRHYLARNPSWEVKLQKAHRLIKRHHIPLILGFRFLYGLRTVVLLALGSSRVPTLRFLLLDLMAVFLWAGTIATTATLFGAVLEKTWRNAEIALLALLALALSAWLVKHRLATRLQEEGGKPEGKPQRDGIEAGDAPPGAEGLHEKHHHRRQDQKLP